ncbi:MAG: type II secretion system F family protein [Clostridia bacterium]
MYILAKLRQETGSKTYAVLQGANTEELFSRWKKNKNSLVRFWSLPHWLGESYFLLFQPKRRQELAVFARQLAMLLQSGFPLLASLQMLDEKKLKKNMTDAVQSLAAALLQGSSLSKAFQQEQNIFPKVFAATAKAGEESGKTAEAFSNLASYLERENKMRQQLQTAILYPCFVFIITLLVLAVLLLFLLPSFGSMLLTYEAELPWFTVGVLQTSMFLAGHKVLLLLLFLSILLAFMVTLTSKKGKLMFQKYLLSLPGLGSILGSGEEAKICNMLILALDSGIQFSQALSLAEENCSLQAYARPLAEAKARIAAGKPFGTAFTVRKGFSPLLVGFFSAGEVGGELQLMLERALTYLECELTEKTARLQKLIEPIFMLVLGIAVALVVALVFLPMLSILGQL